MPIAPKTFATSARRAASPPSPSRVPTSSTRSRSTSIASCATSSRRWATTRNPRRRHHRRGARRSARAATSRTIIGELFARDMQGLARVHARDRRRSSRTSASCASPSSRPSTASPSGAGAVIALACDFRIASETAKIRLHLPEGRALRRRHGGRRTSLPRVVGLARASELLFLGDPIDADEAERIGLVNRVVPPEPSASLARDRRSPSASRAARRSRTR